MISLKLGASIERCHEKIKQFLPIIENVWAVIFPLDADGLTITSGSEGKSGDGVHGKDSLHYKGRAIDLRTSDVNWKVARDRFTPALQLILGPDWDVVFEAKTDKVGNAVRHIHVEYDPKG